MPVQDQLSRYKTLMEMARCFGRAMDLQTLIDEILNRSQEVMRAEACTLFLPDRRTHELILHSTDAKLSALPQPPRVPPGKGISGAVFQTRQSINLQHAQKDPRYFQGIAEQVGFVTRAMLAIPLLDGAECRGVLQALNPVDRECFDASDEEIFEGFGGLIASALLRLEAARGEIELAKSKQELVVAREIQESFLPATTQSFPFCNVIMKSFPASAVGGDFCCVHPVGEGRLLLALGDVTGKGIPAALTMARATAMIKAMIGQMGSNLGDWVSRLNQELVEDLKAGRFIGMTFMLADAATSTLQVCAAGQFAPLHFNKESWSSLEVDNHLPLGIASGVSYQVKTVGLKPGESWLLFSDGIPEARNRAGEEFTIARFEESLGGAIPLNLGSAPVSGAPVGVTPTGPNGQITSPDGERPPAPDISARRRKRHARRVRSPDELNRSDLGGAMSSPEALDRSITAWREHVDTALQHDDASLLLLQWKGNAPPASYELLCCPETLCRGRQFVEDWATYAGFDDVTVGQIVLACDEAATNVFRHGYQERPGPLQFSARIEGGNLVFELVDRARAVDVASIKGRDLADLRPGGLGTVIISKVFEDVAYVPTDAGTSLILKKHLPRQGN